MTCNGRFGVTKRTVASGGQERAGVPICCEKVGVRSMRVED